MKTVVRPKKHLGQHFLNNRSTAESIAGIFESQFSQLPVLEIGPGMGVLTEFLVQKHERVIAIEIDNESIEYLKSRFSKGEIQLIEADFLNFGIPAQDKREDLIVIGNFPYNISSQIVFKILEQPDKVKCFGGMFQKEVAQRLVAGPGSKTYGILSVFLGTYYTTEYMFTVPPSDFIPPPKVQSGVIRCVRKDGFVLPCSRSLFFDVVKTAFNQRRKTLRNALKKFNLDESNEFAKLRAEQLSPASFIQLSCQIEQRG